MDSLSHRSNLYLRWCLCNDFGNHWCVPFFRMFDSDAFGSHGRYPGTWSDHSWFGLLERVMFYDGKIDFAGGFFVDNQSGFQSFDCTNDGGKKEKERKRGRSKMTIFSYILVTFLIVCAVAVCLNKNLLTSIVIFMSYSVIMCIIWILLESPDLAITEAAVGAGVTSLLFFMTLKKIHALTEVRGEDESLWDDEEGEEE